MCLMFLVKRYFASFLMQLEQMETHIHMIVFL